MPFTRNLQFAAPVLIAAALAGCQSAGPGPGSGPIARQPQGVEGEWLSTDGVAMSRFTAGAFETLAVDTGNKLATGSYRNVSPTLVEITLTARQLPEPRGNDRITYEPS